MQPNLEESENGNDNFPTEVGFAINEIKYDYYSRNYSSPIQ